jgi:hypothetical protein
MEVEVCHRQVLDPVLVRGPVLGLDPVLVLELVLQVLGLVLVQASVLREPGQDQVREPGSVRVPDLQPVICKGF